MKFEGYGYEFDAKYIGGPADGLENSIVTFSDDKPPEVSCLELHNLIESKTPLGVHFFKQRPANETRVGVYMLENDPNDCTHDETISYYFIEMMYYGDYVKKYEEN